MAVNPQNNKTAGAGPSLSKTPTSAQKIAAYSESMGKHANIMQSMGAAFMTVFALTNGGLLAAFIAYLATPVGQLAISQRIDDCWWTAIYLSIGFVADCALMLSVIHYCNVKFAHYRKLAKNEATEDKAIIFSHLAILFLFVMVGSTLFGIGKAVSIILNVHAQ